MNELEALGDRLRYQRVAAELKQSELAERAAVSVDTLSALENGRPVTTETLARVLRALGHADLLAQLLPAPTISPLELQKLKGQQRQRVR